MAKKKVPPRIPPNPFKPGAGHSPPHLAGRQEQIEAFRGYLEQTKITKNVILTGLRGVGKTVLMEDKFKPTALSAGWTWVGSDFSESCFLSEQNLCTRLLTDLSVYSSSLVVTQPVQEIGFKRESEQKNLSFDFLATLFEGTPGLVSDKLKAVLEFVWAVAEKKGCKGIVLAYDEAQVVADRQEKEQYPLAVLLETFQSLQRKGARYLLLLTGLPTLFPRLVESRTYAERMFAIQEIGRLSEREAREAITVPLEGTHWTFADGAINLIVKTADGYPYFIQFLCRETFDYFAANPHESIPMDPIVRKLDANFFAGRWEILTNRQRDFLHCIARLDHAEDEFSISDIVDSSKKLSGVKPFSAGDVSQILPRMIEKGLIYRNRHGKYAFAVPLFSRFVLRKYESSSKQKSLFES